MHGVGTIPLAVLRCPWEMTLSSWICVNVHSLGGITVVFLCMSDIDLHRFSSDPMEHLKES